MGVDDVLVVVVVVGHGPWDMHTTDVLGNAKDDQNRLICKIHTLKGRDTSYCLNISKKTGKFVERDRYICRKRPKYFSKETYIFVERD